MIFRKKKTITILNPSDEVISKFIQEGIDTFTIDKLDDIVSLTLKNDRKTRNILKKLDLNEEP